MFVRKTVVKVLASKILKELSLGQKKRTSKAAF
jgi:hypothetical protein